MAKNIQIRNKTSFKTRSAKNLPLNMAEDVKVDCGVMEVIIKRLKNHFSRSQADLQSIISPYTPKKDKFLFIALAILLKLLVRNTI